MVHEAWRAAGPWERISDRAAHLLIAATLILAIGASLFWILNGNPARGGLAALAVAVVACPCAMGIATPLAKAVNHEAQKRGLQIGVADDVKVTPGAGIRGVVNWRGTWREVTAGTTAFVGAVGAPPMNEPLTAIDVSWNGKLRGRVLLADTVRADAGPAIRQLHDERIASVLLSGDRIEVAESVARRVGIIRTEAPRQPEEKVRHIRNALVGVVAMVGDGMNDIPALAAADIGIALGAGTDLARHVGNVVLLSDRLTQIPWLIRLSRYTRRLIAQNLAWAAGYNAIALAAAAGGWLHPLLAAVAMVISSLTVLSNSVRIRNFPDP
jgi:cation transport ATPase